VPGGLVVEVAADSLRFDRVRRAPWCLAFDPCGRSPGPRRGPGLVRSRRPCTAALSTW